jgi:tol-pal system protein YbgF
MNKSLRLLAPLILMAGCSVMTPPSEDPVLIKLDELDQRLAAIERVVQNQSLVNLTQQVTALERRADELQGISDTLNHDATSTADRQRDLYLDLDTRIQNLESSLQARNAPSVLDGGNLAPGQLPVPGGSDRDNYQAAFELVKEQRYEPAALAFKQFLVTFPDSDLASNAQYWLAESYYVTQAFTEALTAFQVVIDKYSRSSKVADALLKMGYCNYELERWDAAKVSLARVQADFPDTTAARLAAQRLKRMETEGV